jgi:uncharacterized LabA/DUF88 family protein
MEKSNELRFAVLIDAENVPSRNIKEIFEEVAKYGTPTFKRIYADWTLPNVSRWKNILLQYAITPIQQYSYTQGKNASDSAMIIDAMDILYSGKVDGFCIVSSDSDFTRLATRLREAGMKVIGIGEKKTPMPFITACEKFIYIEILQQSVPPNTSSKSSLKASKPLEKIDESTVALITDTISDLADENGWVFLGDVGHLLLKRRPDFDSRNYGYSKLLLLMKKIPTLEVDERDIGKSNIRHVYVRVKVK